MSSVSKQKIAQRDLKKPQTTIQRMVKPKNIG
jgi:hypothetical protein